LPERGASDFAATHARFANGDNGAADTEPGHPGNYIPGAANRIASASARVEDLGPWFGALRFRYFGRRPLMEDNSVTSKTDDALRSADRVQAFRAGAALARHPQPVRQYRRPPDRLFLPLATGERNSARLRRPFQTGRAAVGAVHLEHDILTARALKHRFDIDCVENAAS
jgi:hypothetical protein